MPANCFARRLHDYCKKKLDNSTVQQYLNFVKQFKQGRKTAIFREAAAPFHRVFA